MAPPLKDKRGKKDFGKVELSRRGNTHRSLTELRQRV